MSELSLLRNKKSKLEVLYLHELSSERIVEDPVTCSGPKASLYTLQSVAMSHCALLAGWPGANFIKGEDDR